MEEEEETIFLILVGQAMPPPRIVASLIVAVLLVIAGVELVQSAYTVGLNIEVKWNALFFWAVVGTCIIKEVFAQMSLHMSRKIDSSALEADFWHHRTDTITTVLVLISMYVAANYQIYWIDKAACAGVGIFIIYTGIVIAKTAVTPLLGESPGSEEVLMIAEKARAVEGVLGVHDIIVHHYGEKHMVTLHIEVDGEKKVKDVHEIAEEVEKQIEAELPGVTVVHIDPVVKDHPFYDDAVTIINKFSVDNELVVDYSDLLIAGSHDKFLVSCIITVMPDTPESVRNELKTALEDLIDVKGDEISADILVALDHSGASSTIRAANLEKKFLIN